MEWLSNENILESLLSWSEKSIISLRQKIEEVKLIISLKSDYIINLEKTLQPEEQEYAYEYELCVMANHQLLLYSLELRLSDAIFFKKKIENIILWKFT